jgi:hypothetical protein
MQLGSSRQFLLREIEFPTPRPYVAAKGLQNSTLMGGSGRGRHLGMVEPTMTIGLHTMSITTSPRWRSSSRLLPAVARDPRHRFDVADANVGANVGLKESDRPVGPSDPDMRDAPLANGRVHPTSRGPQTPLDLGDREQLRRR